MKVLKWKKTDVPNFDNVPVKPGIYIISTAQEDNNEYVVKYVGQADDLRSRVQEHFSKFEQNAELRAHIEEKYIMKFNYSEVEEKEDRDGMVLYLRSIFNPPYNSGPLPDITPLKCTVPGVRKRL